MPQNGFEQAVDILMHERDLAEARLRAAQEELLAAQHDHGRAVGALRALGIVDDDEPDEMPGTPGVGVHLVEQDKMTVGDSPVDVVGPNGEMIQAKNVKSIRAIVQDLLEQNDSWFTTDEIVRHAVAVDVSDKDGPKIRHNVRSSLWSLRKKGVVVSDDDNKIHRATRWQTQTEAAPAGDSAEAAPALEQEGGRTDDSASADGLLDLRSDRQEDPVHPDRRPPVGTPG